MRSARLRRRPPQSSLRFEPSGMSLSQLEARHGAAVQLDHVDAVAAVDAEGDRAVCVARAQRALLARAALLQPEGPELSRAVVAVDVAAAQAAQALVANHDAAGDRAGAALVRVLEDRLVVVADVAAAEAQRALEDRPAEVGPAGLAQRLCVHLLAAILAHVADQDSLSVDREAERVAKAAGVDRVAARLAHVGVRVRDP